MEQSPLSGAHIRISTCCFQFVKSGRVRKTGKRKKNKTENPWKTLDKLLKNTENRGKNTGKTLKNTEKPWKNPRKNTEEITLRKSLENSG